MTWPHLRAGLVAGAAISAPGHATEALRTPVAASIVEVALALATTNAVIQRVAERLCARPAAQSDVLPNGTTSDSRWYGHLA